MLLRLEQCIKIPEAGKEAEKKHAKLGI